MRTLTRLLLAASISLACFGATFYWYHSTAPSNARDDKNQKPIAFAERTLEDIHRRPVTRLIWQLVANGEPLYPGEAIRTSPGGEVRIQFADSDKYIDLEPDSLIVISQSKNEISLDLMDGSFVVAQNPSAPSLDASKDLTKKAPGPTLTLNSTSGKVDLSNATASLAKTTTGSIDVQVLKGTATVESHGETKSIESGKSGAISAKGTVDFNQDNLKIISPSLESPVYVSLESPQPVVFKWTGFPEGAVVSLDSGNNRKELKKMTETTAQTATLALSPGKHFWKLTAFDKVTKKLIGESPVFRVEVAPRYPPTITSPANNTFIPKLSETDTVEFKWGAPADSTSLTFEIAKDPAFKERVLSKPFTKEAFTHETLQSGDYYWRLGGIYPGLESPVYTKVQNFSVGALKPKVSIGWQNQDEQAPQYFIHAPEAKLGWSSEQRDQVKLWRLKLADNESEMESPSAQIFETKELSLQAKVKKPGRYIAMVEALDEKNRIIASSPIKSIDVTPLPLLPSPKLLPESGDIQANNQGKLELKWTPITGAKEYEVTLLDSTGKEVAKKRSLQASIAHPSLPILFPGKYQVRVAAVDQHGRFSEKPETRAVLVPEGSGLSAPKLKKIKVN